jgi:DNA-binding protein HU-beta
VNLQQLAKELSQGLSLPQARALEMIHAVLGGVISGLIQDGHVRLGELGTFEVKERKARTSRNPRTGDKLLVPRKQAVVFRPASELKTHLTKRPMTVQPDAEVESEKDLADARQAADGFLNAVLGRNPDAGKSLSSSLYSKLAEAPADGPAVAYPEHKEKVGEAVRGSLGGDFERFTLGSGWELTGGGVQLSAELERGSEKRTAVLLVRRSQGEWKIESIASR